MPVQGSIHNLYAVWLKSTATDRVTGAMYYKRQFERLLAVTYHLGLTFRYVPRNDRIQRVVGAFAALSPNNDEAGTYRDLRACIAGVKFGYAPEMIKCSTYPANRAKAFAILKGEKEPLQILGGLKVRNFYLNTINPDDSRPVTVDGHMVSCWAGKRLLLKGGRNGDTRESATITRREYEIIAEDIRILAKQVKLIPCQLQSVLWLTWKRLHKIRWTPNDGRQISFGYVDYANDEEVAYWRF